MTREQLLSRLVELTSERPSTKMGQVRWAWPHIKAALAAGHTLRTIHSRLKEVGIEIEYRTLSLYIGRLERRVTDSGARLAAEAAERKSIGDDPISEPLASRLANNAPADPFSNVRVDRERKQRASFNYDAFSTNKGLLK